MEAIQSADDPGIDATLSLLVEEELGQHNEGSSAAQAQNSASCKHNAYQYELHRRIV